MIIAPYTQDNIDPIFKNKVIPLIRDTVKQKEDDFFLLCVGSPGTGKSMLLLHAYDEYAGSVASISNIGLTREEFPIIIKNAAKLESLRFAGNDEANISKREAMSTYNRRVIDLYFSIRGLQMFHWWNNPSLDIIDKLFIKERIKAVIFIATKDKDKPRLYYYFRRSDILAVYEKYKKLDLEILKRTSKKYAYYRGWFKDYKGPLRAAYEKKKQARMLEKVNDFAEEFGYSDGFVTPKHIQDQLGISKNTVKRYEAELLKHGRIEIDKDFRVTATGRKMYNPGIIPKFEQLAKIKQNNKLGGLHGQNQKINGSIELGINAKASE